MKLENISIIYRVNNKSVNSNTRKCRFCGTKNKKSQSLCISKGVWVCDNICEQKLQQQVDTSGSVVHGQNYCGSSTKH